jgi:hypothetical protein
MARCHETGNRPTIPVNDHTIKCVIRAWDRQILRDNYFIQWPRTCRECDGHGYFNYNNYIGHGDYETVNEPCSCVGRGQCPRCGLTGMTLTGVGPCIFCWWDEFPGAPADIHICGCHRLTLLQIDGEDERWKER